MFSRRHEKKYRHKISPDGISYLTLYIQIFNLQFWFISFLYFFYRFFFLFLMQTSVFHQAVIEDSDQIVQMRRLIWIYLWAHTIRYVISRCGSLTITTSWAFQQTTTISDIFLIFHKTGFDISCKLSPLKTIYMARQNLFSGKNKKNISICRLLKILPRVLSVNYNIQISHHDVNILIMKYFLRSFSPFRWFKKGSCQFLAKECAHYWLTA